MPPDKVNLLKGKFMAISASVGQGGRNNPTDVKTVQKMLQKNGFPQLRDDGRMGPRTIEAIKSYQSGFLHHTDGVVDMHGKTWSKLSGGLNHSVSATTLAPEDHRHLNSGRLTVSAGQVTFDAEGNDNPHSIFFSRHIHWPGGVSGVTIGRGYDMGGRCAGVIYTDLTRVGIPENQATFLAQGEKLKGHEAQKWVRAHRDECGIITREAQARLFELIYPKYASLAESVYNSKTSVYPERTQWNRLKPAIKDIIVDLVYQGLGFSRNIIPSMHNDIDSFVHFIDNSDELQIYEDGRKRARYLRSNR